MRDLSLTTPLDPTKFYNEVRNSIILKKDAELVIEDITSVEMMIIDSLEKLKKVQEEVCKINGMGSLG